MIIDLVDKLADRIIQLLTFRKQQRAELVEQYLSPVFAEFEAVHAAYLESFARYRQAIQDSSDQHWLPTLLSTLDRDNLFSASARSKVLRLVQAEQDESVGPFVSEIRDYLLGARLVDPLGKEAFPHMGQRWRQGLSKTLARVKEEAWQLVIDPDGAQPLLDGTAISGELDQRRARYAIPNDPADALKRSCALWALDEVLWEMQQQYDRVCQAYAQLRAALSK
ncbi:MAG: hypothetical protein IT391_11275 [Nitrospira sp.]|nr:hypothetical protein [Nitrospira sp.]